MAPGLNPHKLFKMKKGILIVFLLLLAGGSFYYLKPSKKNKSKGGGKSEQEHHLNIPSSGIQSLMEANTQKIIEGTDGSVLVMVGEIRRKKVDITIKHDNQILDERILSEHDHINFQYEGVSYTLDVLDIKKPLLGDGKAEISIR